MYTYRYTYLSVQFKFKIRQQPREQQPYFHQHSQRHIQLSRQKYYSSAINTDGKENAIISHIFPIAKLFFRQFIFRLTILNEHLTCFGVFFFQIPIGSRRNYSVFEKAKTLFVYFRAIYKKKFKMLNAGGFIDRSLTENVQFDILCN